jgi:predicted TPR repeat methyltransferase
MILVLAAAFAALYLRVLARTSPLDSLEELENRVRAGNVSLETWCDYAERLRQANRHADAASAWGRALELAPSDHKARRGRAIALAQAGVPGRGDDQLYNCLRDLLDNNQFKLVTELFKEPQLQAYLSQDRFVRLHTDAMNQSID